NPRLCHAYTLTGSRSFPPHVDTEAPREVPPAHEPLTFENPSPPDGPALPPPPLPARPAQVLSRHARAALRISHRKNQMIARGEMGGMRGPRRPFFSCRAPCRDQKDEAREEHTPPIASHLHSSSRMIRKVRRRR